MTFWSLTNSDFPTNQTFHQFHDLYTELDLHLIMSGFHGAFATGVASQQGTLTLPDTWFRPPFWDLLMLQLLRPNSSNLPCLYSTFHLEYPLVLSRFCPLVHYRYRLAKKFECSHGIGNFVKGSSQVFSFSGLFLFFFNDETKYEQSFLAARSNKCMNPFQRDKYMII